MLVYTLLAQLEDFDIAMQEKEYRNHRSYVAYEVTTPTGVVFRGDTFSPSWGNEWDSWQAICELLFWITCTPESGATMDDYTMEQLEWAKSIHCVIASYLFGDETLLQGDCHTLEDDPEESDFAGNVWLLHEISYSDPEYDRDHLYIIPMRTRYVDTAPMWIEQSAIAYAEA